MTEPYPLPFEPPTPFVDELEDVEADILAEAVMAGNEISASAERKESGRAIIRARWGNAKVKLVIDLDEHGLTDWAAASNLLTLFPNIVLEVGPMLEDPEVKHD